MRRKQRGNRPELDAIFADLSAHAARGELPDLEAANAFLALRSDQLNETPDPAMQGLSPRQASALIYSDWHGGGPVRLDTTLPATDWADCPVVFATLGVLRLVAKRGPLSLTKAGFVRAADLRKCTAAYLKVVEAFHPAADAFMEEDAREDAATAIEVLAIAGLLVPSGATLGVSNEASDALRGSVSRFAARIAEARLRVFAAEDESPFDDLAPGLRQPAMVMRALFQSPDHPVRVLDVIARSWLPPLSNDIAWAAADHQVASAVFAIRYSIPLEEYGLIELTDRDLRNWKKIRLRVLPRFRRFVQFSEETRASLRLI